MKTNSARGRLKPFSLAQYRIFRSGSPLQPSNYRTQAVCKTHATYSYNSDNNTTNCIIYYYIHSHTLPIHTFMPLAVDRVRPRPHVLYTAYETCVTRYALIMILCFFSLVTSLGRVSSATTVVVSPLYVVSVLHQHYGIRQNHRNTP